MALLLLNLKLPASGSKLRPFMTGKSTTHGVKTTAMSIGAPTHVSTPETTVMPGTANLRGIGHVTGVHAQAIKMLKLALEFAMVKATTQMSLVRPASGKKLRQSTQTRGTTTTVKMARTSTGASGPAPMLRVATTGTKIIREHSLATHIGTLTERARGPPSSDRQR